jgi:hypothetical protein
MNVADFCEVPWPVMKGRMKRTKACKQPETSIYTLQVDMLKAKTQGELIRVLRKGFRFNDMPHELWEKLERASKSQEPI